MIQERLGTLFRKRTRHRDDQAADPVPDDAHGPVTPASTGPPLAARVDDDRLPEVVHVTDHDGRTWEELLSRALDERVPSPTSAEGGSTGPTSETAPRVPPTEHGEQVPPEREEAPVPDGRDRPRITPAGSTTLQHGRRVVRYRIELGPLG